MNLLSASLIFLEWENNNAIYKTTIGKIYSEFLKDNRTGTKLLFLKAYVRLIIHTDTYIIFLNLSFSYIIYKGLTVLRIALCWLQQPILLIPGTPNRDFPLDFNLCPHNLGYITNFFGGMHIHPCIYQVHIKPLPSFTILRMSTLLYNIARKIIHSSNKNITQIMTHINKDMGIEYQVQSKSNCTKYLYMYM